MQAIEFKTTAQEHMIRVPDTVPDGVQLRVLLLLEETQIPPKSTHETQEGQALKALLASMPDIGDDEDFSRPMARLNQ